MAGGATYGYGLAQGSLRGMSSIKREALSLSPFLSSSLLLYLSISLAFNIKQEILSAFAFVIPYIILRSSPAGATGLSPESSLYLTD